MGKNIQKLAKEGGKYLLTNLNKTLLDIERGYPSGTYRIMMDYEIENYRKIKTSEAKRQVENIINCGLEGELTFGMRITLESLSLL